MDRGCHRSDLNSQFIRTWQDKFQAIIFRFLSEDVPLSLDLQLIICVTDVTKKNELEY